MRLMSLYYVMTFNKSVINNEVLLKGICGVFPESQGEYRLKKTQICGHRAIHYLMNRK
jgi:hypothetical protein